jgi:K+-sensing histidine kinase KdpD
MIKKYLKPIIEVTLANFLLYLVLFRLQPNPEIYFELNPHPLIFVVLIFALVYGNFIGFIATMITEIFYIVLFYEIYGDLKLLVSDPQYFKYPLLFLWITTVIGTIIDNHMDHIEYLRDQYRELKHHYKLLKKNYIQSERALDELEEQIIDADMSIIALYDIAQRLKKLDQEEILTEILGIFSKYLKATKISIYSNYDNSDYLRLKLAIGVDIQERRSSKKIEVGSIEERVIREKETFRYTDAPDENDFLLIGPILKDNKVIGIIIIEEMFFDQLSNYAYTLFKVILEWVNLSIDNARIVEAERQSQYHNNSSVLKYIAFKKYLSTERRRRKEYGLNYFLLTLKAEDDPLKESQLIKSSIRDVDRISFYEDRIYVLFPGTPEPLYDFITEKIFQRIDKSFKVIHKGPKKARDR